MPEKLVGAYMLSVVKIEYQAKKVSSCLISYLLCARYITIIDRYHIYIKQNTF